MINLLIFYFTKYDTCYDLSYLPIRNNKKAAEAAFFNYILRRRHQSNAEPNINAVPPKLPPLRL